MKEDERGQSGLSIVNKAQNIVWYDCINCTDVGCSSSTNGEAHTLVSFNGFRATCWDTNVALAA